MSDFRIDVSWLPPGQGPIETAQTAASIEVHVRGHNATFVNDEWSKSVQTGIRVSAYPFALWVASAWWRLRWEPRPFRSSSPPLTWRMAHELPSAGSGFLWPLLAFDSDGTSIGIHSRSNLDSQEPVRFLASFHESIPATDFEAELDSFINTVLARLTICGISATPLQELWSEVVSERIDAPTARMRKIEALLGYDPGEAPDEVLLRLTDLSALAGAAAVDEIAPVCAGDPIATLDAMNAMEVASGSEGRPSLRLPIPQTPHNKPWELGWELAHRVRQQLCLNGDPMTDARLADLLGLQAAVLEPSGTSRKAPLSLAIRTPPSGTLRFLFRKRNTPGMRFEAARFLCEHLLISSDERWLPVTDTRTNRQKTQRAFAAELLCPIEPLRAFLNSDFSEEAIEQAADYFVVSPRAVTSTLVNHGDISPDRITD